jgi:hypothetical protein
MQGIMDELVTVHGATIAWDVDTVPDGLFLPMAHAVAVEVNVDYPVRPPFDTRSRALMRLRAALFPDDRAARADLDDDGTVTADEAAADARGAFY